MAILIIADCPLCGHQAQAWTTASGVWSRVARSTPNATAMRLKLERVRQLRRDRHTALRS